MVNVILNANSTQFLFLKKNQMDSKINIIINGQLFSGTKGEYILQVAKRNGIEIPTLCNDPRLEPFSSCFVCVVEIEGMRGLQPACSTRISEGMSIQTESSKVRTSRKAALDLIMSNHYADCVAPCKQTCPAGVDVQGYISLIEKGFYQDAVALIKETNPLPAICGRVCVRPCEVACRRNLLDEGSAVGIDYMKRFVSDFDLSSKDHFKPEVLPNTGKKIAIIGAGPGGLSAAYFLQQKGHQCDIYEAAPYAGGWLRYGIPEYRLPNDLLDKEIETITELGVRIFCNKMLGGDISYQELQQKYQAVILTIGSQKGTLLGTEGEDAQNVFSGIDFLRTMEITGKPADFKGKKVVVVGGGNTAMDCCRTAIRCGSTDVKVVYRRTENEMPANPIEIHESKLEGVEYLFLSNPIKVNKDENSILKSVTLIKMGLGDPDASGRRRPMPIEGSEFEIEADYILAAIGQKTDVNFINDVNEFTTEGKLVVNKWGDIDADKNTLQTGIPSMFAAGDGVTGPATIIEAIAQAQKASLSCHQFLSGLPLKAVKPVFLSKKDNFKKQISADYFGKFTFQKREEMPVLAIESRKNFKEVELGYSSEIIAKQEANRCLECGCVQFNECDLQKYSDQYGVEQTKFSGDFNEYEVNFSHPYIEIDSNKCILCSRCIRICSDYVGANALGLVNRGFKTYVAPSLGDALEDSNCESCGLCISTCPTGAITENFTFKPGPLKLDPITSIDSYGSEGVSLNFMTHNKKFVMKVEGKNGLINPDGSIGRRAKFGYKYLNDCNRILKPLLKINGEFKAISFEEAFSIIIEKIKATSAEENVFFAGARLSNEEIFSIQKIARQVVKTPYISNFHYLGRGKNYSKNSIANVPFSEIGKASKIFLVGAELIDDNDFVGFLVQQARTKNINVEMISSNPETKMFNKVDDLHLINDYFYFIKAVNYYLITENLENKFFIDTRTAQFDSYKLNLLKENYQDLIDRAGVEQSFVENWAKAYNEEINAVLIFSEKYCSANTSNELYNLALITGKLGKTASGLIPLKTKNNAQGLFDMGAFVAFGPGQIELNIPHSSKLVSKLDNAAFKNAFVFGEDPIGTAYDSEKVTNWFSKFDFVVVQECFMSPTASLADLILPASFIIESEGSFTNTQKVIQYIPKQVDCKIEFDTFNQLTKLGTAMDLGFNKTFSQIQSEIRQSIANYKIDNIYHFLYKLNDSPLSLFNHGADFLMKQFDEDFENSFK